MHSMQRFQTVPHVRKDRSGIPSTYPRVCRVWFSARPSWIWFS